MASIEVRDDPLAALASGDDGDGPLVMINLLRYREAAAYPPGSDAEPCTGREAYQRYSDGVMPCIRDAGGRLVWLGRVRLTLIAPAGEEWDDAILVEYPSREAFLGMLASEQYQACAGHRTAAVADSRLLETTPGRAAPGA